MESKEVDHTEAESRIVVTRDQGGVVRLESGESTGTELQIEGTSTCWPSLV